MRTSKLMSTFCCAARHLFLSGVLSGFAALVVAADERPNIIFIMVDDMGYADLGVTSDRHDNTPHIDRLAQEGVLLANGYANSAICSPTRTALITGNYQYRYGIGLHEPIGPSTHGDTLPKDEPNLPRVFTDRGYHTSLVGKWHLGYPPKEGPLQNGYDYFFGIQTGAADYFRHRVNLAEDVEGDGLYVDNELVERDGYLTTLFTDETVRLIEEHAGKRPFFISLHYNAPHWPWVGPNDEDVSTALTDIFHWNGGDIETYANMMRAVDDGVARILDVLKEKGIDDNTIVVFTSDNGGERFSDTWPFVGNKGEVLEGGIRAPILVRWPARIVAGTTSPQVMLSMDFLPTLAAATGKPVDDSQFDGMNLLPVLTGEQPTVERTVFWRFNAENQAAVRQGDWKYLRIGGKEHLFNLAEDTRERARLNDRYPEKLTQLKQLWQEWNAQMLPYREGLMTESLKTKFPDRY